jgi:hypothetical protein
LAEADLRQRGPGEFFGMRQAGLDGFQIGDLAADLRVLEEARAAAVATLRDYPDLDGCWAATRDGMEARWASRLGLARVSARHADGVDLSIGQFVDWPRREPAADGSAAGRLVGSEPCSTI